MIIHKAYGFALNGSKFHVLRIHIVMVGNAQPLYGRGLLGANFSTTEIRERIREQEGDRLYRGSLRLGENDYKLAGIITMYENGETRNYTADIIKLSDSAKVGNISVITRNHDGVRIGEGSLTMNGGNQSSVFRVLLNIDDG